MFYNVGMTSINTPTESIANSSRYKQSGEKTSTLISQSSSFQKVKENLLQRNLVTKQNICKNIKMGNILSIENSLIDDKMNIKRENVLSIENSLFDDKMNKKNNYINKSNMKKIDSFENKT